MGIRENVHSILSSLPSHVTLEAAAKTRTPEEIRLAVDAGVTVLGENYLNEGIAAIEALGRIASWHYIGRLQSSKIRRIVASFDMVETVDTIKAAERIDAAARDLGKVMPILIEVNSACEDQKGGFMPEDTVDAADAILGLGNVSLKGLMTMGPWSADPESVRPYYSLTKGIFDSIRSRHPCSASFCVLSMGMSASYGVGIEEGATLVRVGQAIFGPRQQQGDE